jgi:hypothetical protein
MNIMRQLLIILALSTTFAASAQSVTIRKDPRVDMLLKKQADLNKQVEKLNNKSGPGYRVMVVNTNDRSLAMEVKSKMMTEFSEHKSYLVYQSPYFKIQVGNFKTRQEAEELRNKIKRFYENGVMIVPATVEYKVEKEDMED